MPRGDAREFMEPLVNQWLSLFELAKKEKESFNIIAYQCDSFFSKQSGFMWSDQYKNNYIGKDIQAPKFMVTINKAFELVALFGPYLFWKYPQVFIQTPDPLEITPDLFGDPNDENVQAMFQQVMMEQQGEHSRNEMRNRMMERYLNYASKEQPGGGLKSQVEVSITEALVKGRSCIWTEGYQFPGSERNLTQGKWRSVDYLYIDHDSRDPFLSDADYIFLVHDEHTTDQIERKFKLPRGYLRGQSDTNGKDQYSTRKSRGKENSGKKTWIEIWSKRGVGTRIFDKDDPGSMFSPALHNMFDEVVGDHAYMCITDGVPFPLNAPSHMFRDENNNPSATDEEVQEMFQWRAANYGPQFPCHADNRWPVAMLDFYRNYSSCWPIAPLAPALGELTILNILSAAFTEQSYENRKSIIAFLASEKKAVEEALSSTSNPVLVAINDQAQRSIGDMIQFLNRPEANTDIREAIAFTERLFEQRTGLNEFMYAMQQTQDRTARGTAAKEEKASIRPEKMSGDVADFLTQNAELSKFLAGWTVTGQDLQPLLGSVGAHLWDQLIAQEDPEVVVREMRCSVQAADHRKPNQERLLANMQQSLQFLLPILQEYAAVTGDTAALNDFLASMNKAMEDKIMPQLGPWRPEPDEQQQQIQQMQMQLEQAKLEAEVQVAQLEVQAKQVELQQTQNTGEIEAQNLQIESMKLQQQMEAEAASKQMEFGFKEQESTQSLMHSEQKHEQDLMHDEEAFEQDLQQKRIEAALKIAGMRVQTDIKLDGAKKQAAVAQRATKPKPTGAAK